MSSVLIQMSFVSTTNHEVDMHTIVDMRHIIRLEPLEKTTVAGDGQ